MFARLLGSVPTTGHRSLAAEMRHDCIASSSLLYPCLFSLHRRQLSASDDDEAARQRRGRTRKGRGMQLVEPVVHLTSADNKQLEQPDGGVPAQKEALFLELQADDLPYYVIGEEIEPLMPKNPMPARDPTAPPPADPWVALGDANPLTVDPQLVPEELRWAVIELQADAARLLPFHEEFKNSKIYNDFHAEAKGKVDKLWDAWMNDPEPPNKRNIGEGRAQQERIYDEVRAKHIKLVVDDPEKIKELENMAYYKHMVPKIRAAYDNMPTVLREIMADEADPLRPKMTHQIHKEIRDTLRDDDNDSQ